MSVYVHMLMDDSLAKLSGAVAPHGAEHALLYTVHTIRQASVPEPPHVTVGVHTRENPRQQ